MTGTSRRRRRVLGVLALLAGLAALAFALARQEAPPEDRYVLATVARGTLSEEISANGTINPSRVVNVGSQVSGTVQRVLVDFNDRVVAGQLLLELDPSLFRARLAQSEAALANARAQAALARANRQRAEELFRQDFISRQDLDSAVAALRSQDAQVASAEAAVAQDRANLAFSIIRAPVAGTIINRKIDVGQTVAAAFQTPELFTIAEDLAAMQIEALVAEADVARVREGQSVTFTVDAWPGRLFEGRVRQIRLNPTTQQNVVTFTVVIGVDNADGALLPGMTANVRLRVREWQNVLLVPNAALSWRPPGWTRPRPPGNPAEIARVRDLPTILFAMGPDGQPEARRVRLGASDETMSLVEAGELDAGDRVILAEGEGGGRGVRVRMTAR